MLNWLWRNAMRCPLRPPPFQADMSAPDPRRLCDNDPNFGLIYLIQIPSSSLNWAVLGSYKIYKAQTDLLRASNGCGHAVIAGQFQGTGHIFPRDGLISLALGMRHKSDF